MSNKNGYHFDYIAEEFYSKKKDKSVFCIRLAMYNKDNKIVKKSDAIFWLNEEQYLDFISEN